MWSAKIDNAILHKFINPQTGSYVPSYNYISLLSMPAQTLQLLCS